jgi:hypothetical protein
LWVQSERLELPAPICRSIAESLDSYAAWQPPFDRCSDKIRGEERERDRHVDLTHAAFLACRDLLNIGHGARHNLIEPATTSGDCANEARAAFDPRWTDVTFGDAVLDSVE